MTLGLYTRCFTNSCFCVYGQCLPSMQPYLSENILIIKETTLIKDQYLDLIYFCFSLFC